MSSETLLLENSKMLLETAWVYGNATYLIPVSFIDPQSKPVVSKNPEYCRSKQQ